jgi:hypothetical protein
MGSAAVCSRCRRVRVLRTLSKASPSRASLRPTLSRHSRMFTPCFNLSHLVSHVWPLCAPKPIIVARKAPHDLLWLPIVCQINATRQCALEARVASLAIVAADRHASALCARAAAGWGRFPHRRARIPRKCHLGKAAALHRREETPTGPGLAAAVRRGGSAVAGLVGNRRLRGQRGARAVKPAAWVCA